MSKSREYIKKLEEQLEGIRELIIGKDEELENLHIAKRVLEEKISEAKGVGFVDDNDVRNFLNKL